MSKRLALILASCACLPSMSAVAQTCPDFTLDRQPYVGDTHIHTAYSFDSVLLGVEALPPSSHSGSP